jgi:uncharacterized protein (TIGR02757 family)
VRDREIVAFVAAGLAYGRVAQILRSVEWVVERLGPRPRRFLERASRRVLRDGFSHFRHRFTSGDDLVATLWGLKGVLARHGSLEGCFVAHARPRDDTVLPALCAFMDELRGGREGNGNALLVSPRGASACKKLNLFLRWMVRKDAVDPGGWEGVSPSRLIVPLDVHMHRVARRLGMTRRLQADMRTALEVTAAFRRLAPADPARYDFVLTRPGIWGREAWDDFSRHAMGERDPEERIWTIRGGRSTS